MHLEYFSAFLRHLGHELADWRMIESKYWKEFHTYCPKVGCGKMFKIHNHSSQWTMDRIMVNQYGHDREEKVMDFHDRELSAWNGEPLNYHREKATIYKQHLCSKVKAFL
jgi:hypothetical protein